MPSEQKPLTIICPCGFHGDVKADEKLCPNCHREIHAPLNQPPETETITFYPIQRIGGTRWLCPNHSPGIVFEVNEGEPIVCPQCGTGEKNEE